MTSLVVVKDIKGLKVVWTCDGAENASAFEEFLMPKINEKSEGAFNIERLVFLSHLEKLRNCLSVVVDCEIKTN